MPHGGLEFLQFATQTHIEHGSSPINVGSHSKASKIAEEVAPLVEQTILDLVEHTQHGFDVENDKLAYRCQPEHTLKFQKYPCILQKRLIAYDYSLMNLLSSDVFRVQDFCIFSDLQKS